jgi:hypothetical protein
VLYPIVSPPSKFDHVEKGDALYGESFVFSLFLKLRYFCSVWENK